MNCKNCGNELTEGMKFCMECGAPVPQTKKCIKCGAELPLKMKFCGECGTNQEGQPQKANSGFSMGDKNVIAGDVIGSKEETHISGNATIVKNEDQTKQVKQCHVCGSVVQIVDGYNCPECGEFTCSDCFDVAHRVCKLCVSNLQNKNEETFKNALKSFLQDGMIDISERQQLKEMQVKYGISDAKAKSIEDSLKGIQKTVQSGLTTIETINLNKAKALFYQNTNSEESYKLLEPIYQGHKFDESILSVYLPVLIEEDIVSAKKLIEELNVDVLSVHLAAIKIALKEGKLDIAEKRIIKAKQIWLENSILKYYEIQFFIDLVKATGEKTYLQNAEEIVSQFVPTNDKLELTYQTKAKYDLAKIKNEDTSWLNEEFYKTHDVYREMLATSLITVGKNHEVKTLSQALSNIGVGGTIILEPGKYHLSEYTNIDKKIKIIGLTEAYDKKSSSELPIIVIDSEGTCELTADVEIEGVIFTHNQEIEFDNLLDYATTANSYGDLSIFVPYGEAEFGSMLLVNSDAKLNNIYVIDSACAGITFVKSNGILTGSIISNCDNVALYFVKETKAKVIDCGTAFAAIGILVTENATPEVSDTSSLNNYDAGIKIDKRAKGVFSEVEVFNNKGAGILICDESTPAIENSEVYDNKENGFVIKGTSKTKISNCKIYDNKTEGEKYPGVVIKESANPEITGCEVYGHLSHGLWIKEKAAGVFKNLKIHSNASDGIDIIGESTPTIENSEVYDNKKNGFYIKDTVAPKISNCKIYDNKTEGKKYPGVLISGSANPEITDCEVYGHLSHGLWIKETATGTYKNIKTHANKNGEINIQETAKPTIENCGWGLKKQDNANKKNTLSVPKLSLQPILPKKTE